MSKGRTELRHRWSERDERYVRRRQDLSDAQIDTIKAWRLSEAEDIADFELMAEAQRWTPPPMIR